MIVSVTVGRENRRLKTMAFFDSGNQVFTKNGEAVVIVDPFVYNRLGGSKKESIEIMTVAGVQSLYISDGFLYKEKGNSSEKIDIVMACAKHTMRYGLLLNTKMEGILL